MERNGRARSFHIKRLSAKNLKGAIREQVSRKSKLMTDELAAYNGLAREFARHERVKHSAGEYARNGVHVNTAESYFALLKRGVHGTFHHVSKRHLHRYLAEFDFRFGAPDTSDAARTVEAIRATEGKRLTYRPLTQNR